MTLSTKKLPTRLRADEQIAIARTANQLARAQFKARLLEDILFDLQVCRIEGWDCKEYVRELKQLIDDTYKKVVTQKASNSQVEQGVLF